MTAVSAIARPTRVLLLRSPPASERVQVIRAVVSLVITGPLAGALAALLLSRWTLRGRPRAASRPA